MPLLSYSSGHPKDKIFYQPMDSKMVQEYELGSAEPGSFQRFTHQLMPLADFITQLGDQGIPIQVLDFQIVEVSDLSIIQSLPGLNEAKVVCIDQFRASQASAPKPMYVFKGADFRAWREREGIERPWEKYKRALYEEHSLIEELTILCALPAHPNIIPRPPILAVTGASRRIVGFLQPLRTKQTIEEQVAMANREDRRIALATKAKWCLGMAEGLFHVHRTARSFHMDMKPGNVLIEDDGTPRIIDWQQQGLCRATHPPEATLGVHPKIQKIEDRMRADQHGQPLVVFTPRPGTWPEEGLREAYLSWQAENPTGIEAAEVFMLGRTMWHLLEQQQQQQQQGVGETSGATTIWTDRSVEDIPMDWKDAVMWCLAVEPARRPRLEGVVAFWTEQVRLYCT